MNDMYKPMMMLLHGTDYASLTTVHSVDVISSAKFNYLAAVQKVSFSLNIAS